jgi:anti-anti-sigma regulatory factor
VSSIYGTVNLFSFSYFSLAPDLLFIFQEMLRVSKKANADVVFTLSGRLDKDHIAELEMLIAAEGKDRRIILDLKDVTLTGEDGIVFLARCEAAAIALVNCDPYIREWITRQGTGS